jgi:hypothetical protein
MIYKPYMARTGAPRYTPFQEQRHKRVMERLTAWRHRHQEPHELRLRDLLKTQPDCWR